ncbi:MAG TPA: hypothetical protein VLZ12_10955 [Verrucomicrobiae bacterium]|nr:hypothetical protein [Verrucomicrobiae bacterium]
MTEWDIQPRSSACTVCQQPFGEKQVYHTLLATGAQGYTRRDLCCACISSASRDGVISYWQGEYKTPLLPPPEAIQKETAETLLRKLIEVHDPNHAAACYILAVMLERKRILKHRDTVTDAGGAELLVYEHAQSGESFTVFDPHLRLDQLEEVQHRVAELLQPEHNKAEAEPAVDSAPAD